MWSATVTHARRFAATASILISTLALAAHSESAEAAVESFPPISKSGKRVAFRIDGVEPAAIKQATARLRVRDRRGTAPRRMSHRIPVQRVRAAAATGRRLRVRPRAKVVSGQLRIRRSVETVDPLPQPPSECDVDAATMTAAGCSLVTADTAAQANSLSLWRRLDCANASRQAFMTSGGDPAPTATGESQGNSSYRQLTVLDGDAAYSGTYYSERCELGKNNLSDTFQLYGEGERRITFASFRLPQSYPLAVDSWHQVVMQMKQTQPSNNGGGPPILGLHAIGGRWKLNQSDSAGPSSHSSTIWSTPAQKGVWTRVALDVTYSQDRDLGRIKLYVDANGDGDALDTGEQSPTISTYTLKYETAGTDSAIPVGDSIPSHLRVGPYRSPDLDCPATGCSVQVDNVEVLKP